ncbi:P-loop containing nucleoside triphosphate hydrolase protein [Pelagophyceae sp. CCMP2097]|nr:P-loop containing nucleoside triphosphate hydrolase protein [Pelagophyceae sp. CCMP2097]
MLSRCRAAPLRARRPRSMLGCACFLALLGGGGALRPSAALPARRSTASLRRRTVVGMNVFEDMQRNAAANLKQFQTLVDKKRDDDMKTLEKFTIGLAKSRDALATSFMSAFGADGRASLDEAIATLQVALTSADIGYAATEAILDDVRSIAKQDANNSLGYDDVRSVLRGRMVQVLTGAGPAELQWSADAGEPTVIVVIGSNGMGKTTTIGKLAARLRADGKRVVLAACDTYRAAAVEQLDEWAKRAGVDIVVPDANIASPAAAAYKALDVALGIKAVDEAYRHSRPAVLPGEEVAPAPEPRPYDVLIVDTSGRLSNNVGLTEELKKVRRTIEKRVPSGPHEVLLVVDAAVGRNAVDQARTWKDEVGVSGLVVTKLDGTSRAGFCVSVVNDLTIPVKLVGVGEKIDDLRDFEAESFVDSLLDVKAKDATQLKQRFEALRSRPEPVSTPPPRAAAATAAAGSARRRPAAAAGFTDKKKKKKKK